MADVTLDDVHFEVKASMLHEKMAAESGAPGIAAETVVDRMVQSIHARPATDDPDRDFAAKIYYALLGVQGAMFEEAVRKAGAVEQFLQATPSDEAAPTSRPDWLTPEAFAPVPVLDAQPAVDVSPLDTGPQTIATTKTTRGNVSPGGEVSDLDK